MLYDIAVHPELDVDTAVHVPSLSQLSVSLVATLVLITHPGYISRPFYVFITAQLL